MYKVLPKRTEVISHSESSVSLERVKAQLRIELDDTDEDVLLGGYIDAATSDLEKWLGYYMLPAELLAVFDYCGCSPQCYVLEARPFFSIDKIEVLQDGSYIELTTDQYSIEKTTWETYIKICPTIDIDLTDPDNGCAVFDQVKITYNAGDRRVLDIDAIFSTGPNVALVAVTTEHGLSTGDRVFLSDTGVTEYDGEFVVTVGDKTHFSINYLGIGFSSSSQGTCTIPEIPSSLELAVIMMVASMYVNRGDCSDSCGDIPCVAQKLARRFRRYRVMSAGGQYGCCCG
jgi:hypothetical protein